MVKRLNYIDYCKAFAITLVITGHICLFSINNGSVDDADNMRVYQWLTNFQMPLFFFLSGIVIKFRTNKIKDLFSLVYKKVRQLIVPFLFFGLLYTFYIGLNMNNFFESVMKQGYWYLLVLFELYVIYYFFTLIPISVGGKFMHGLFELSLIFIIYVALRILTNDVDLNTPNVYNYLSIIQLKRYLPYFFAAILIKKYDLSCIFTSKYIILISFFTVMIVECTTTLGYSIPAKGYWLPWVYIIAIVSFLKRIENRKNRINTYLLFIGRNTLIIYVLHFFIVHIIRLPFMRFLFQNANSLLFEFLTLLPLTQIIAVLCILLGRLLTNNDKISYLLFYKCHERNN